MYDNNGNLVSKTGGGSTTSYTWDWRNQLVSVYEESIGRTTDYGYDGDGNRISKTQGGVKMRYINDVARVLVQVLMETDNTGTIQAVYAYGNDLISMSRAGADVYYHYDGLGTTRQLTDSAGAAIVSYMYDAFGNLIPSSGTSSNPYGFTGEQQFGEADDLVFLRARYYDPQIGRFISRDPIGYGDGMNLYTYVNNSPIRYVDPLGLSSKSKEQCEIDYLKCLLDAHSEKNKCSTRGWIVCGLLCLGVPEGYPICVLGCRILYEKACELQYDEAVKKCNEARAKCCE